MTRPTVTLMDGKAWARCELCGKLIRVNKPVLGSLHVCLTACEAAGWHLEPHEVRRGPFWKRRTVVECARCGAQG